MKSKNYTALLFAGIFSMSTSVFANDESFAKEAAQTSLAEIKMGELAKEKSNKPKVIEFGQTLIDDHSKANTQLKDAAGDIELPETPNNQQLVHYDMLKKLSGKSFDKEFRSHMIEGHQKAIKLFEKEASAGKSAELKKFAVETLPTLKEHLKLAQNLPK